MTTYGKRAPRMAPDARRAAIVNATLPLVLRHGSAVTTRQIAEAAGIAEGTIFRVFPDKESVVEAVVAEALDQTQTLRELAAVDRTQPLRERLIATAAVLQRRVADVFGLLSALGWTGPPHRNQRSDEKCGPPKRPDPEETERAYRAAVVDIVGPDEPLLRVPATELAHVMRLLVFSGTHPLISAGKTLRPEEIVSVLLDGLLEHSGATTTTEDLAC